MSLHTNKPSATVEEQIEKMNLLSILQYSKLSKAMRTLLFSLPSSMKTKDQCKVVERIQQQGMEMKSGQTQKELAKN